MEGADRPEAIWNWTGKQGTVLEPLVEIVEDYYRDRTREDRRRSVQDFRIRIAEWGHKHLRNRWSAKDERVGAHPESILFAHTYFQQNLVRVSALVDVRIEEPGADILLVLKHLMYIDIKTGTPTLHPSLEYAVERKAEGRLQMYFPNYNSDTGVVQGHPQIQSVASYDMAKYRRSVKIQQNTNEFPRLNVRANVFTFIRAWVSNSMLNPGSIEGNVNAPDNAADAMADWRTFTRVMQAFAGMEQSVANPKHYLKSLWKGRSYDLMAYGHSNVAVWGSVFISEKEEEEPARPYTLQVTNVYASSMPMGWENVKTITDQSVVPATGIRMTRKRLAAMVPVPEILAMDVGSIKPSLIRWQGKEPPETNTTVYFDPVFEDGLPLFYYSQHEITDEFVRNAIESEHDERLQHMQVMLFAKGWLTTKRKLWALIQREAERLPSDEDKKKLYRGIKKYITSAARVWFSDNPEQTFRLGITPSEGQPSEIYGKPQLADPKSPSVNFVAAIYERFVAEIFPQIETLVRQSPQISYEETEAQQRERREIEEEEEQEERERIQREQREQAEAERLREEREEAERRRQQLLEQERKKRGRKEGGKQSREAVEAARQEAIQKLEEELGAKRRDRAEAERIWEEEMERAKKDVEEAQSKAEKERAFGEMKEAIENLENKEQNVQELAERLRRERAELMDLPPVRPLPAPLLQEEEQEDPFGTRVRGETETEAEEPGPMVVTRGSMGPRDMPAVYQNAVSQNRDPDLDVFDRSLWFNPPHDLTRETDPVKLSYTINMIQESIDNGIHQRWITELSVRDYPKDRGSFLAILSTQELDQEMHYTMTSPNSVHWDPEHWKQILGRVEGDIPPRFTGFAFRKSYRGKMRDGLWEQEVVAGFKYRGGEKVGSGIDLPRRELYLFNLTMIEPRFDEISRSDIQKLLQSSVQRPVSPLVRDQSTVSPITWKPHVSTDGNVFGWLWVVQDIDNVEPTPKSLIVGVIGGEVVGKNRDVIRINLMLVDSTRIPRLPFLFMQRMVTGQS